MHRTGYKDRAPEHGTVFTRFTGFRLLSKLTGTVPEVFDVS
jgi:hypothetical protein